MAFPKKDGSRSLGSHDLFTVTPLLTTVASGSITVVGANRDFLNTETPRRPRPRTRATTKEDMRGHPRRARNAPTHRMKRTVDVCFWANDIPLKQKVLGLNHEKMRIAVGVRELDNVIKTI